MYSFYQWGGGLRKISPLLLGLFCLVVLFNTVYADQDQAIYFTPGDAIEINVFPDTSSFLNEIYPIDGGGHIYLPLVGKIKISHMREQELIDFLLNRFREYLKFPNIQTRRLIRISALGGFASPGFYYVDPDYPLWNVVDLAGGTLEEEGLKEMRWERNKKRIQKNLIPIVESNKSLTDLGFKSGDQIWTPTPQKENKLAEILSIVSPVATMGITLYTFYYFTQTGQRTNVR